jgi:hypothetical protein
VVIDSFEELVFKGNLKDSFILSSFLKFRVNNPIISLPLFFKFILSLGVEPE